MEIIGSYNSPLYHPHTEAMFLLSLLELDMQTKSWNFGSVRSIVCEYSWVEPFFDEYNISSNDFVLVGFYFPFEVLRFNVLIEFKFHLRIGTFVLNWSKQRSIKMIKIVNLFLIEFVVPIILRPKLRRAVKSILPCGYYENISRIPITRLHIWKTL